MFTDLRQAWRALVAAPVASLAVVLSLALGLGLALTVFGAADALLWRPLPYREPSRLVLLERDANDATFPLGVPWSRPAFLDVQDAVGRGRTGLADVAAFAARNASVLTAAGPHRAHAEYVSGRYFPTLGIRAQLGRTLLPSDDAAGAAVAVLDASLWRRAFLADPTVVGRVVMVEGRALTVVGVLADGQHGQGGRTELWIPAEYWWRTLPAEQRQPFADPHTGWLQVIGRLRAGVTPAALGGALTAAAVDPDGRAVRVHAVPLGDVRASAAFRHALLILLAAAGVLLAIAAVNTSTVLLVRAHRSRHALAVRSALGASRGRLARAAALEALLLTSAGAAGALACFRWSADVLAALAPADEPRAWEATIASLRSARLTLTLRDAAVLSAAAVVVGLIATLAPARWAARAEPARVLADGMGGRGGALAPRGRVGARGTLVAGQLALTSALLACALLLGRSFAAAVRTELGFVPEHVVTAAFELPRSYDGRRATALVEEVQRALQAHPAVRDVSFAWALPLSSESAMPSVEVRGGAVARTDVPVWGPLSVGPGYFRTLGIALPSGREFGESDRRGAPRVAIVSAHAARTYWPGRSPVGEHIRFPFFDNGPPLTIVGVAADVPYGALADRLSPAVYVPALQTSLDVFTLLVRYDGPAAPVEAALRRAVVAADPTLPVGEVRPLAAQVARARAHITFASQLFAAFAVVAVLLSALGVYGVASAALASRTRELAVRAALGATRARLVGAVARDAITLSVVGLAVGLGLARVGAGALGALLYGVAPADPLAFALAALGFGALVAFAAWLPARRAAAVDPATALRSE